MGPNGIIQPQKPPKPCLVIKIQAYLKFDEVDDFIDHEPCDLYVEDSNVKATLATKDGHDMVVDKYVDNIGDNNVGPLPRRFFDGRKFLLTLGPHPKKNPQKILKAISEGYHNKDH